MSELRIVAAQNRIETIRNTNRPIRTRVILEAEAELHEAHIEYLRGLVGVDNTEDIEKETKRLNRVRQEIEGLLS